MIVSLVELTAAEPKISPRLIWLAPLTMTLYSRPLVSPLPFAPLKVTVAPLESRCGRLKLMASVPPFAVRIVPSETGDEVPPWLALSFSSLPAVTLVELPTLKVTVPVEFAVGLRVATATRPPPAALVTESASVLRLALTLMLPPRRITLPVPAKFTVWVVFVVAVIEPEFACTLITPPLAAPIVVFEIDSVSASTFRLFALLATPRSTWPVNPTVVDPVASAVTVPVETATRPPPAFWSAPKAWLECLPETLTSPPSEVSERLLPIDTFSVELASTSTLPVCTETAPPPVLSASPMAP